MSNENNRKDSYLEYEKEMSRPATYKRYGKEFETRNFKEWFKKHHEDYREEQIEREIANEILNKYIIFTLQETDELCLYKEGCFIYGPEVNAMIRSQITEISETIEGYEETISSRRMIFEFIKSISFSSINDFDADESIINLKNGLYFIKGFEKIIKNPNNPKGFYSTENGDTLQFEKIHFKPHYPRDKNPHKSFIQLPIKYDSNATCLEIDQFLTDVFGFDTVPLIYEWIAYNIMNTVKYQKALMLYGPTKSGKTTFLLMLYAFLGRKHVSEVSLQDLWRPFQAANLRDKLANIHDDLDLKKIHYVGMFKKIVTNKYLSSEVKNVQKHVEWINRTKLSFSCNRLPQPKDVGDDFYSRWILVPCFNQFIGDNKDPDKLKKITTPEELSGLFNKIIEAWTRLEDRKGFSKEWNDIDHVKGIWEMDINPVKLFVDKYCDVGKSEYEVDYELFHDEIRKYRKKHNVKEISKTMCTKSLKMIDERIKKKRVSIKFNPDSSGNKYVYIQFNERYHDKLNNKRDKRMRITDYDFSDPDRFFTH